jgi:DNA-binding transcriptional regulator PaaX
MARKSQDFKDLMKQKQSSQDKQKNLEALRKKMVEGGFGELAANIPIEPKGAPKMSEILQQFVAPYLDNVSTLRRRKSLFSLAAIAWNTALATESEKQPILEAFLEKHLPTEDAETQHQVRQMIDELITRKHQHFSDNKYFILDFQITETGQRYDISVASTLLANPQ